MTTLTKIPVDIERQVFDYIGTGAPGTILANAPVGATYRQLDGGVGSMLWQKSTAGWEALQTSAWSQALADTLYGRLAAVNTWLAQNLFTTIAVLNSAGGANSVAITFYPSSTAYGIGMGPTATEGYVNYYSGTSSTVIYGHRFYVNSVERFKIAGDGSVAVPSSYFTVGAYGGAAKSVGDIVARRSATTGVIYFGESSSSYLYWDGSSYYFGGTAPLTLGGALYAPNVYISGGYGTGVYGTTTTLFHTRDSHMGYSVAYPVVVVGGTSGNRVLALGVDPIANTSGAFSGAGSEILTPNVTTWLTPDAANTSYQARLLFLTGGDVRFPVSVWFGSNAYVYDDGTQLSWVNSGSARPFYIQASFPTTYIYSANIFLGNTSGAAIHVRGNVLYFGASDQHYIYGADVGPVSYGTLRVGGARGGYSGFYYDDWSYWLMNHATIFGQYHATYSWHWYFTGSATTSWWDLYVGSVVMAATYLFYLDGGGDTYIREVSANLMDFVVGGSTRFRLGGGSYLLNYSPTTTEGGMLLYSSASVVKGYLYWDSGGVGILDSGGSWRILAHTTGGTLYGAWSVTGALTLSTSLSVGTTLSVSGTATFSGAVDVVGAVRQKKGTSTFYDTPSYTVSSSAAPGSSTGYPAGHIWLQVTAPV